MSEFFNEEERESTARVSYSQYSMWHDCPFRWYLKYAMKHKLDKSSIHALFGTALHETLQEYLTVRFNESVDKANQLDLDSELMARMQSEFKSILEKEKQAPSNAKEMAEFYMDGVAILHEVLAEADKYFPVEKYELVGIEVPIDMELKNGVNFIGYLDVVLKEKHTGKIKIIDIKTSTRGWSDWTKRNELKNSQLVLYKNLYSKKFNVPKNRISVVFFIVARKIQEGVKRIDIHVPHSGKATSNMLMQSFGSFINSCFTENGIPLLDKRLFPKMANASNCKFCEFHPSKNKGYCDSAVTV